MKKLVLFFAICFALTISAQNIPSYVPSNGLVAWYPFNGNANDESGNGNNGTVNGATLTTDRDGNANSAYDFDGSSQDISSSLPTFSNQLSISVWIIPDTISSGTHLRIVNTSIGTGASDRWLLALAPTSENGTIQFGLQKGGIIETLNGTNSISLNIWSHVALTFDSGVVKIYINGILDGSDSFNEQSLNHIIASTFYGSTNSHNSFFDGKIDDIAIYNRALSPSEIQALYNGNQSMASINSRGCVECDALNIGDEFVLNGDSMIVVDRPMLDSMIAGGHDVTKACVSHVTYMRNLLRGQSWFNQDISSWDVSNVTNMNRMFKKASAFNQNISNWDVGNVNRMTGMFELASAFNQDLSDWCVRAFQYNAPPNFALNGALIPSHYPRWGNCPQNFDNITTLATGAFLDSNGCIDCSALNIGDYFELGGDTLLVVDRAMLDSLVLLHDDLSKVCVSHITDMKDALRGLSWFNTDISKWDVSNVTDMSNMFWKARIFNQDIGNWDVSKVKRMNRMFKIARDFNQNIGSWDVGQVERFQEMFRNADAFNQDIGYWNVSSVLNDVQMQSMFRSADNFSQDLTNWCVSSIASKPTGFDANSPLTSSQLPLWGGCPPPASNLGTDTLSICGQDSVLISARSGFDTYAWNTGETSSSIWVSQSGMYSVASTMSGQYTLDSSVYVSLVNATITANDSVVCAGDSVTLTAGGSTSNSTASNYSLSFDGIDDYVECSSTPNWFSGNSFTWSFWVKMGNTSSNQLFIKSGTAYGASGNGAYLNYFANRVMFTSPANGGEGVQSSTYPIAQNTWTHIALSVELNNDTKLYINGQDVSLPAYNGPLTTIVNPSNPMFFGRDVLTNSQSLNGQMEDIQIWNTALTQTEIQQYMNCPPTGNEAGLVGYWNFDEGLGSVANDLSGNGNHGTINGASWSNDAPLKSCSSSNITYSWSTGDTTSSITTKPSQTTTYYCTVSDGISTCTDSVTVYVNSPVVDLGADTLSVCGQDSVLLDAGAGHSSYLWNTGETTQTIYADASGTYSVEVSDGTPSNNSSSLSFDGNGNKIQVSANPVLNTNDLTLSCWVKLKSYGPYNHFINKTSSNDIQFAFANNATGLYAYINNDFYQSASLPDLNSWNYLTLTFSSSTKQGNIYINDSLVFSFLTTSTIIQSTYDLFLGGYWNATYNTVDGEMDNIQIWNTALTQTEIQQYMNCPPTGNEAGLVGYWNFDEGSGSVANDLSGNGNHGTINGASWSSDVPSQSCGLGCTATDSVYVSLVNASITTNDSVVCAGDSVTLTAGGGMGTASSSTLPAYLPTNGLVAWYPFNGNANDESGNGNNGSVNGATLTTDRDGNANSAYDFDGSIGSNNTIILRDEYIKVDNFNHVFYDSITISVWVKNEGYTYPILQRRNNNSIDFSIGLTTSDKKVAVHTTAGSLSGNTLLDQQKWRNVCLVYDGNQLSIYVDGVLDKQVAASGPIGNSINELWFGKYIYYGGSTHYEFFDGQIDDIAIYNRALSASEIQSLYTANASNVSYNWSTGDTTASITANPLQTTTYYCTVSDGISTCTDSVTVYVNSPVVDLGADTLSVCGQDSVLLDAGAGHSSYLWNTGETTQTIYADASGTYSVEVSDGTPSNNSSSLSFDGVDDFVSLANSPISVYDYTFHGWIKIGSNAVTSDAIIASNGSAFIRVIKQGGDFVIGFNSPSGANHEGRVAIKPLEWAFVSVTQKSDSITFYINGVLDTVFQEQSATIVFNSIGAKSTQHFINGELDNLCLWNTALTQTEIQQYMSCPPTGNEAGLVGYWNFDEGSGSVVNDLSGNGNHGTINGASWSSDVPSQSCGLGCTATDSVYVSLVDASITASDSIVCAGDSVTLSAGGGMGTASSSTLPAYLPTNGLVAWYPFNGNANDESGNGNNGTVNGATLTTDRDGNANSAYDFDGAAFIDISSSNIFTPAIGTQFTLSSWVNPSVISGGNTIISKYQHLNPTNCSFFFMINPSGGLNLAGNGTDDFQSSPSVVNLNTWNHIAFQISNSGFVRFYLNGLALDSGQISLNSSQSSLPLRIGSLFDAVLPQFFDGQIDDIAIYNRALSASEIQSLYTANASNVSYNWSTGDTTASITANPLQTTTYYCTVSDGISTCTDSVTVYVNSPVVDLGADTLSVCGQDSILLDAGAGHSSYLWNTGETTQTIYADASGTYSVEVSDGTPSNNSSSLSFDGCNWCTDYVDYGDVLDMANSSFSYSVWVKVDSLNAPWQQNIVSKGLTGGGTPSDNGFKIDILPHTNTFHALTWSSSNTGGNIQSNPIHIDKWYYVTVVIDRTSEEMKLYVDGSLNGSSSLAGMGSISNNGHLHLANQYWANTGQNAAVLDGSIFEFAFWNTALTQTEIQQYMSCPPTGNEAGLVGYWNFEEGSGSVANDLSGNGNHGTINGASWSSDVPSQSCGLGCTATDSVYVSLVNASITTNDSVVCAGDSVTLSAGNGASSQFNSTSSSNLPTYLPTNGLVHFFPLNGSIIDLVGGINGNEIGSTYSIDRNGTPYSAASLDGNDHIVLDNTFYGGNAINELSYNVWVKIPFYHDGRISGKEGYWKTISLNVKSDGGVSFGGSSSNTYFGISSPPAVLNTNQWHMVTVSLVGGILRLYVDGVEVSSGTCNASYLQYQFHAAGNSTATNYLGAIHPVSTGVTNYLTGEIDDFGLWNRALTPSEIQSLYTTQPPSNPNLSYNWSTGDTTTSITANPLQTTTYYCTVSDGISTCTDSVTVYVNSPVVDLGADTLSVCGQDSVLLDAGAGHSSYLWNTGETTQTIYADASGMYSVEVSDGTPSNNSSSLSFDGVDDFVEVSNTSIVDNTDELTINIWFKPSVLSSNVLVGKWSDPGSSTNRPFILELDAVNNRIQFIVNGGAGFIDMSASVVTLNQWNYISCVYDGVNNMMRLYHDGQLISQTSISSGGLLMMGTNKMNIGTHNNVRNFTEGFLDDIHIWNTALTQTEIQQYMNCPPTGNEAGLVGYWNFEEGSGSVVNDLSGNGNHGTINGASWSSNVPSQSCGLGCTATDSVYVSLVDASITASDSVVCAGDSVSLTAGNGASSLFNSASSSNLPTYLPTNGLVAWYPFNGNANDESGNGFDGSILSGISSSEDRFNNQNSAMYLNGNSYISLSSIPVSGVHNFTLSAWIRTNSAGYRKGIFGFGTNYTNNALWLFINNQNKLQFDLAGVAGPSGNVIITDDLWHHISVIHNNGLITLYVDGIQDGQSQSMSPNINPNGNYKKLGGGYSASLLGYLDDVSIWNKALSASEIQSLYSANASNLSFNWSTGDTTASITTNPTQTTTYYCTVSDGITSCTDSVEIKVGLMDNPADVTVDLSVADTASFSVNYLDSSTSYQWEINSVVGWLPLLDSSSFYVGGKSHLLKLRNIGTNFNGLEFRCIVTSPSCSEVSDSAVLTVISAGAMVSNPISLNEAVSQFIDESNLTPLELPVSIRPNPTTGIFHVHPFIEGTYSLIDSKGRTVERGRATPSYDLSSYPNGVYILRLTLETSTHQIRVIKQ